MLKKRGEKNIIAKELYLVDVSDPDSLVPDAKTEQTRLYALWDAVTPQSAPSLILVCYGRQVRRGSRC